MDERGQEPVEEDQPVLHAGAHGPLPHASGKPRLVTLLRQRADLIDEFSNHSGSQTRDPPIVDDHHTRRVPHHLTMINHPDSTSHPLPCTNSLARRGANGTTMAAISVIRSALLLWCSTATASLMSEKARFRSSASATAAGVVCPVVLLSARLRAWPPFAVPDEPRPYEQHGDCSDQRYPRSGSHASQLPTTACPQCKSPGDLPRRRRAGGPVGTRGAHRPPDGQSADERRVVRFESSSS